MKYKQNLHTHTTFCDGKDTPGEMVQFAIRKGFDSLGFSSHAYEPHFPVKNMLDPTRYKEEITQLKEKYRGVIDIFLGLEMDALSEADMSGYDYLIGSVHNLKKGSDIIPFDRSAAEVKQQVDQYFGGDGMAFARLYYQQLAELPRCGDFDIIGHFDIITKNIDFVPLFDPNSEEYLSLAFEAIHALKGHIPFFELNTGAIARGYRKTPYPTIPLLKEFRRLGFGAVISSDCHNGNFLDCYFDEAKDLLLSCGFREQYVLTAKGFQAIEL